MDSLYFEKLKKQVERITDDEAQMMCLVLIGELEKQDSLNQWLVKTVNELKSIIENKQIKSVSYVWTKNGIKKIEKDLIDEKD